MLSNVSLRKKIVLLVAAPLLLELSFLGVLASLLHQAEVEREAESHARELAVELNVFLRMTLDITVGTVMYYFSKDGGFLERLRRNQGRLRNQAARVTQLTRGFPEEEAAIAELNEFAKTAEDHFRAGRHAVTAGDNALAAQEWKKMRQFIQQATNKSDEMVARQLKISREKQEAALRHREQVEKLLIAGVLFNLLMAAGGVIALNRSLSSRVQVLMDNMIKLASNKPLNPPLSGKDEIAQLDAFFRQMSSALAAAKENERAILAMVTHDLRSPMTSVQLFHSSLADGLYGELNERGQENLAIVERELNRLIELINDLLDIEKIAAGELSLNIERVNLQELMGRAADALMPLAQVKAISVKVAEGERHDVMADDARLLQVLVNLLSNAIKFSPQNSTIVLSAAKVSAGGTTSGADSIRVCVSDQAKPIPQSAYNVIFERFKQLHAEDSKERKGSGLGLAISKGIIGAHKGTIGVEPGQEGGNRFWFELPALDPPLQNVAESSEVHPAALTEG